MGPWTLFVTPGVLARMNDIAGSPIEMVLDEIDRDECIELLRTQTVDRLAVADHG